MVTVAKPQRITAILKRLAFAVTCSFLFFQAWLKFTTNLQRPPRGQPSQFAIDFERDSFTLAGEPVRILSGSLHYFRTPRELWMERLTYARAAGLNTIDTFVEWSSHEPEEGHFDFRGQQDLVTFLEMAHNLSLMVILRPGPYIGAERDMGGLPYWLLRKDPGISLRTMDTTYIKFADRYLTELFKRIKHLLVRNGGPIIMVQVENKYGLSRECNRTYLRHLRDLMRQELGSDAALFTTDRFGVGAVPCGRVEGVFPAIAFGAAANVSEVFATLRLYQERGPLFVSELYTGWYDRWAMPHKHVDRVMVASTLRQVLLAGASVNLYMFHGGTSFGFSTGAYMVSAAGRKGEFLYRPLVTSYDFGGPLTEDGDPNKLFVAVRHVISEAHGLMLYDATLTYQPHEPAMLSVEGIRDSGYVYVDGSRTDTFLRPDQKTKGIAFLNGFNLGRYWPARGPQKTLYVPRTLFRKKNLLVLVELEGGFYRGGKPPVVHFEDKPELHGTVHKMDE
ncbi:beta-galactosidase-1-like protein [Rhipicephalus sanguineus]|uniref:beta-galactosidase-1-like protein n=1 Tax=Rhipicephalus sanguineus TaxID=34632 RepID=UPI0020C24C8B|nr:beta-galactosidase-1-like protein [Rhipicephalus sanguineus]